MATGSSSAGSSCCSIVFKATAESQPQDSVLLRTAGEALQNLKHDLCHCKGFSDLC